MDGLSNNSFINVVFSYPCLFSLFRLNKNKFSLEDVPSYIYFSWRNDHVGCGIRRIESIFVPDDFNISIIGKCFVLSQRTLKSNPCAFLFVASSSVDVISLVIGLIPRILSGWDVDPTGKIDSLCKLRAFIVFSTRTMAIWLIATATVDRWLLSSRILRLRQMSTLKNAQYSNFVCSYVLLLRSQSCRWSIRMLWKIPPMSLEYRYDLCIDYNYSSVINNVNIWYDDYFSCSSESESSSSSKKYFNESIFTIE